jgi:mono/diheme cytochrome c family protein
MTLFQDRTMLKLAAATAALALLAGAADAQEIYAGAYPQQTGEALYKGICQGCHMPDAKGATGAGTYPALAGNKKLGAAAYPVLVVLRGQKAMPDFGPYFTDEQVAAVVNYIRTSFGNTYADKVTAADVAKLRPAARGPKAEALGPVQQPRN